MYRRGEFARFDDPQVGASCEYISRVSIRNNWKHELSGMVTRFNSFGHIVGERCHSIVECVRSTLVLFSFIRCGVKVVILVPYHKHDMGKRRVSSVDGEQGEVRGGEGGEGRGLSQNNISSEECPCNEPNISVIIKRVIAASVRRPSSSRCWDLC